MGNKHLKTILLSLKNIYKLEKLLFIIVFIALISLTGCNIPTPEESIKTRMLNASMDIDTYNSMKPQLAEGIALNKAIELGLTYNLELWLAKQELAIQKELKNSAIANMLPDLTAQINNGLRDSNSASNSVGLFSGQEAQNVQYSYSDMKSHTYGGVNLLWNVIDFGVSYFRSRQASNRTIHALHEIRRIRQKLAYEITQTYWQCVSLELIVKRGTALADKLKSEITAINESKARGRISESAAIERRYPLKAQLIKLNDYSEMYHSTKLRLSQLMGLPIGAEFSMIYDLNENPTTNINLEELEELALNRRPELFQEDIQERITHDEARATILSMLPSPQMFINPQADDNKFLYYNSWLAAGLNVSWNLLDIPNKIFKTKSEYKRVDFIRKKRMALAVAIITQLRIATIEYDYAVDKYNQLKDLMHDSEQITLNAQKAAKAGKGKKSLVIMKELDALRDYAASIQAYSRVMIAKARINNTIGIDPTEDGSINSELPIKIDFTDNSNENTVYPKQQTQPAITKKKTSPKPATTVSNQTTELYATEKIPTILNEYSPEPKPYF